MRAWKWLFIIEGVITIAVAFVCFFILPNFPRTTSWLTEEEKALAVWRLEDDIGEDDWIDSEHQTFWKGAKMAFMDIKTYVLVWPLSSQKSCVKFRTNQTQDRAGLLHRGQRDGNQLLPHRSKDPEIQ
jgi:hypothetical protein